MCSSGNGGCLFVYRQMALRRSASPKTLITPKYPRILNGNMATWAKRHTVVNAVLISTMSQILYGAIGAGKDTLCAPAGRAFFIHWKDDGRKFREHPATRFQRKQPLRSDLENSDPPTTESLAFCFIFQGYCVMETVLRSGAAKVPLFLFSFAATSQP